MTIDFEQWCRQLRDEIEEVYVPFDFVPEHWRDDFDKGRTPAEAFNRIIRMSTEAARQRSAN